jgi:CrcB protein
MKTLASIALFGALGASCRHLLGTWLKGQVDTVLPVGTIVINLGGSFLLGLLTALAVSEQVPEHLRAPLAIGFLGGFTTFSTFSLETVQLVEGGRLGAALANVGLQVGLGLLAAATGLALGRGLGR